jgi:malonate transporter and related proteins
MSIALIIAPIFALILLGWAARRWMERSDTFWRGLERLIYFVFFPALLFQTLSHSRMDIAAAAPMLAVGIAYTLLGMGLGYLSKFLFHDPPRVFAAAFQCSFRFNSYIGLAVAGALRGKPGIAAIGLLMGFLVPLANVAAVAVLARHGEGNWVKGILGNPLILATAGGVAFAQAGLSLPGVVDNALELLSRASLPLGLIAVGAGMRVSGLNHARGHLWYGVTVKLLLLPAIAWGLGRVAGLSGLWFDTALLLAALPHSTVAYLLAVRMGGDGQVTANQISVTTLLSMLTLPFWLALAGGY